MDSCDRRIRNRLTTGTATQHIPGYPVAHGSMENPSETHSGELVRACERTFHKWLLPAVPHHLRKFRFTYLELSEALRSILSRSHTLSTGRPNALSPLFLNPLCRRHHIRPEAALKRAFWRLILST